ncbi:MAG: MATE family efflux transporter [Bacteroidota bacterium]
MLSHPFRRELSATLRLAGPLILAQLAQIATSFVDTLMIGRWLGPEALAAGVLGSTVFFTTTVVGIGFVIAVGPTVAQAFGAAEIGEGTEDDIGRAARQGLWLATLLAVPLMVLLGNAETLLLLAGQPESTSALAGGYLRAILWGTLPNLWFAALRGLLEGLGRPRVIMLITLGAVALNVAGNYALMIGAWGFPALGLAGCGWSSTLVFWAMFVALAIYVHRGALTNRYRVLAEVRRPDPAMLRDLVRIGWPIGITLGIEAGLFMLSTLLVGRMGDDAAAQTALAAHQIALNAASISFMVPLGLGLAATARVGQAIGRNNVEGAKRAGWAATLLGAGFMLAAATLFWLRPRWVVAAYVGLADPEMIDVITQAVGLLGIAAVFQLVDGIQVTMNGALRGLKDTKGPMWIALATYWGIGLTLAAVLGFGWGEIEAWGAPGVWWGLTAGLAAAAVALAIRFQARVRHGRATEYGQARVDDAVDMDP